jgi:hypothetical protein
MSALNIANSTVIIGRTSVSNITTLASTVVSNAGDTNALLKINTIFAHNRGNSAADVTVLFNRGSNTVIMANTMTVPTRTTLTLLAKDMSMYLEENDTISAFASANNAINIFVSYEQLS